MILFILLFIAERAVLDHFFPHLCNCLPDDYQSTVEKLKSVPQLSNDDHQQLVTMISSSHEVKLVKEKIVTFLIVQLCYNRSSGGLVGLCDVLDNLVECDELASCVQQLRCGKLQLFPSQKDQCVLLTIIISAVTEEVPSIEMIPTNSSLQESLVTTDEMPYSITNFELMTSLSVCNQSITSTDGHEISVVTKGTEFICN